MGNVVSILYMTGAHVLAAVVKLPAVPQHSHWPSRGQAAWQKRHTWSRRWLLVHMQPADLQVSSPARQPSEATM